MTIDRIGVTPADPVTLERVYFLKPWRDRMGTPPSVVADPTISGTVAPGATVTAVAGSYAPPGLTLDGYVWTLETTAGAIVATATGTTYAIPVDAATGTLMLEEVMRDSKGRRTRGRRRAPVQAVAGLPRFTSNPAISGVGVVGQVLTCVDGNATGSPAPVVTRQWMKAGVAISGATATTYTIVSGDAGSAITCVNTATNTIGGVVRTATATSNAISPVAAVAPSFTGTPSISGSSTVGNVLTAVNGTAIGQPPPTLTGQWQKNGSNITGATGLTYTTVAGDIGAAITYRNTATNSAGSATASSGAITIVSVPGVAPSFTRAPAISGNTTVGSVLTCVDGAATGTPTPSITRQWMKNGVAISGATATTYTTVTGDIGASITCMNTATNGVGTPATSTSGAIVPVSSGVAPQWSIAPVTTRDATTGRYTATDGTVAGNPAPSVVYIWQWATTANGTYTDRSGGQTTDPLSFIPTGTPWPGKYIRIKATASNGVGSPAIAYSNAVLFPELEGFITHATLSGSSPKGNTLTLAQGTWHGNPTTIENQWFRIPSTGTPTQLSTTGLTRVTGNDDVGNEIGCRVKLTYASGGVYWSPSDTTKYTNTIKVTEPVATLWPHVNATIRNQIINIKSKDGTTPARMRFDTDREPTEGQYPAHPIGLAAYAAFSGSHDTANEKTALYNFVEDHIKRALGPDVTGVSSQQYDPPMQGGYICQHVMVPMEMMAYAKQTPELYDRFSAAAKSRMELLAKAALWSSRGLWRENGDSNQHDMAGYPNNTNRSANPNLSCAPQAVFYAACAYMGGIAQGREYLEKRNAADTAYVNQITDMYSDLVAAKLLNNAFCFNPTRPVVPPDKNNAGDAGVPLATVQTAARSKNRFNNDVANALAILKSDIDHCFSETVDKGYNDGTGILHNGEYRGKMHLDPDGNKPSAYTQDEWDALVARWNAIKGNATGKCKELNSADANSPRASIEYAMGAVGTVFHNLLLCFTFGFINPADLKGAYRNKLFRGAEYMDLISPYGFGWLNYDQNNKKDYTVNSTGLSNMAPWGWPARNELNRKVIEIIDAA